MVDDSKYTFSTMLSLRPPTEPIDRPWPPEQVPPVNKILVAAVDGDTVVLVFAHRVLDRHAVGRANVEAVGVGTEAVRVAVTGIDRDARQRERVGAVDGEDLMRRIQDVNVLNGRVGQVVRLEELGLGLARVALAVPPQRALAVQDGRGRAGHLDAGARDREQRARPLLVRPTSSSLRR